MIKAQAPKLGKETQPPIVNLITGEDVARFWPWPLNDDNKYSRGVLSVLAGSAKYPGAGVLVCKAAVNTGASFVRYLGEAAVRQTVLSAAPEVVLGHGESQALVMGSGFDARLPDHRLQLTAAWQENQNCDYVLLDAGALTLVGKEILPHERCLLTPHAGEAARLATQLGLPATSEDITNRPYQWAKLLAAKTGAYVALKGKVTVISAPGGELWVVTHGTPDLATAGSGDVLAGITGFLLAARKKPADLGLIMGIAAWIHAEAGRLAAPTPGAAQIAAAIRVAISQLKQRKSGY